jgi:hypothetical protein
MKWIKKNKIKEVDSTYKKKSALHLSCKKGDIFQIAHSNPFHIHGEQFVKFKHMVH